MKRFGLVAICLALTLIIGTGASFACPKDEQSSSQDAKGKGT
jgi:hypothetical protein